jgi:isoquinoline 1-oxidoreductase beta subunit
MTTAMITSIDNVSRRHFLGSSAGLTLGLWLGGGAQAATLATPAAQPAFEPNAFLRIGTDNTVTVISKHLEMGQGTHTGLATLAAEELDAAWAQVRVESAPADARRYNNLLWGPAQGTGGSTAMANSWQQMRQAGASARAMLVSAAARRWSVPAAEITVREGVVLHAASKRQATFGEMAEAAGSEPVPATVALKDAKDFRLIGKVAPRKDSAAKTNGRAQFTQDVQLPGMLVAVVAHSPRFGGKVKSFDASKAKAVKGVVDVVAISTGVAVLARDTWSAKKGRDALVVVWDDSAAFKLGTDALRQHYRGLADTPGLVARKEGQTDATLAQAPLRGEGRVIRADVDLPFLAHAAMEPMNCVVQRTDAGCTVWNGEQMHTGDQFALAQLFGIAPEQVTIHTLFAGGSFGRRASKDADYVREAASIVKASGTKAPVKMVWLREDDMKAGYYRPMFHHRLEATLAPDGGIAAWRHRLVGQSIAKGSGFESVMVKDGVDMLSVEGASTLPYAIPNLQVELHTPQDIGVPVLWWRAVGSTHTAFATETFLDVLASEAKQDPVALRLRMLEKHPRHVAALALVSDKAGWGQPLAKGKKGERRGRGVALHESFGTVVAQVAEVTVARDGSFRVDRVVTAVDCGVAINPDNIRSQVEGSVGFALSAALHGEITLKDGVVEQANFGEYASIRISEMPKVDVHIVPSGNKPTGIGEPAVPPLAPALVNALAAATGKRAWRLPLQTAQFKA